MKTIFCTWLMMCAGLIAGPRVQAASVTVFAAASLMESLKEIGAAFQKTIGDKVVFDFGASSTLARQIEEGAPADVFFSADEAKMDALEKKGLIVPGTRRSRLSNSLVFVVDQQSTLSIKSAHDLTNAVIRRVAVADPKTVPAGMYAREYLESRGVWKTVEKKVVPCDNVRAALAAVESGNVEAGIVYKTDAGISKKVKVAYEVPVKDGPTISYPMAVVNDAKDPITARRFLDFLASDEAGLVFERFGFIVRK